MQSRSLHTARPIHHRPHGLRGLAGRMVNWLVAADTAYRARQKTRRLTDEQLRDVGLTRDQIEFPQG